MKRLDFPELDAVFEEVDGAVEVSQHGKTYRARKWSLTDGLEQTIHTAVRFGYTSFWINGHPSAPYYRGQSRFQMGSHCLTFARSHDEKWIFVADKPPTSYEVCFTRGLRDLFEQIEQKHEWEHSGGHNLRIPLARLEYVLERLKPEHIDNLHRRVIPEVYIGREPVVGLSNEPQLHEYIVRHFAPKIRSAGLGLFDRLQTGPKSVPDIIVDAHTSGLFILELKFSHVGLVEYDQLLKYLNSSGIQQMKGARPLHGVLIGRDFSPNLVALASKRTSNISLYSFGFVQDRMTFRLVAGQPLLQQAVPQLF